MYATLAAELKPFVGRTGFRPMYVAGVASCVYHEQMAGGDDLPLLWQPSPAWVYKFMHDELNCSYRRATSSRPDVVHVAETDALHLRNMRRIAVLRGDGYEDWQFMTNDQFGAHLYPQHKGVWTEKGAADVYVDNFEEKRQYTGNICANGAGEVRRAARARARARAPARARARRARAHALHAPSLRARPTARRHPHDP